MTGKEGAGLNEALSMELGCVIEIDWDSVDKAAGTVQFAKDGKRYTTLITTVLANSEPLVGGYYQA